MDTDDGPSISAVGTDLSEHKRTEAQLRQYREHLEEMVVERTKELVQANEEFQVEVEKRISTEESLQKTLQELEQANEELLIMNEEFETGNEELQSTTEQLRDEIERRAQIEDELASKRGAFPPGRRKHPRCIRDLRRPAQDRFINKVGADTTLLCPEKPYLAARTKRCFLVRSQTTMSRRWKKPSARAALRRWSAIYSAVGRAHRACHYLCSRAGPNGEIPGAWLHTRDDRAQADGGEPARERVQSEPSSDGRQGRELEMECEDP